MQAILGAIASRARSAGDRFLHEAWSDLLADKLREERVLLLDEIDAQVSDSLLSVLRQLREGYDRRLAEFPQSMVLCGVRDVRDTGSTPGRPTW